MRRKYEDGQTRFRRRFLWLPKTIRGELRWLEFATWTQAYIQPWNSWEDQDWIENLL